MTNITANSRKVGQCRLLFELIISVEILIDRLVYANILDVIIKCVEDEISVHIEIVLSVGSTSSTFIPFGYRDQASIASSE